ncbi:hypothetical protein [Streptomyces sp. NPDC001292]|uniref:hypothetical protein n=1 Tax=Streptomyces sp. NPDC001292 TaxID=3364558 RepID=UPI0036AB61ED
MHRSECSAARIVKYLALIDNGVPVDHVLYYACKLHQKIYHQVDLARRLSEKVSLRISPRKGIRRIVPALAALFTVVGVSTAVPLATASPAQAARTGVLIE